MDSRTVGENSDHSALRRANLKRLFNPKSIAVVGASSDPAKAGSQALQTLSAFPGTLVAVHPREKEIRGYPCYPSLADLPEPVDLAILAIPAKYCLQAVSDAAAAGVGGVFIISGGFAETGREGRELQVALGEICRTSGLRLLGPNTSGFVNPNEGCIASFVPGVDTIGKGSIAVVAQSGGVNLTTAYLVDRLGDGVSIAVGLGNAVDVGARDMLELLADDPNTGAVALHLEGVPEGRALFETLQRVTPKKPVVAVVAGRTDIGDFAVSHTGNLMGSRQRTVAALVQSGAVVVDTLDDMAQAASVLSRRRLTAKPANGMALITGQAGPGLLIADALKASGIDLPKLNDETKDHIRERLPPLTYVENPVDTGRPGPGFSDIVTASAKDPAIDAVLVFGISEPSVLDPAEALIPAFKQSGKPIVFGTLGPPPDIDQAGKSLEKSSTPMVLGPDRLALSGTVLDADSRHQHLLAHRARQGAARKVTPLPETIDESKAKEIFRSYGIATPQSVLCTSRDEAEAAFARLEKPVVVKVAASDIAHKTESGGVILDIGDEGDFVQALDRIAEIETSQPGRVLVEEMAPAGVEIIVGGVRDPSWGPCVMIGLGGILAEAISDTAIALAPIGEAEVAHMLNGLRSRKLLDGFRSQPACDLSAIASVAIAVGQMLQDHPEILEIEINPLRANEKGALALDGLIVLKNSGGA